MASTDPSPLSNGGSSAVGRRLNPAAPMFLPRVPVNNHFYWYRHYSSPPPSPPSYYAAVSAARVTIQTPISYIPLYHHPHGYYPNPSRYSTVQSSPPPPPPPPQLLRSHLSPAATTEPDPDVSLPDQTLMSQKGYNRRQSFISRKGCRRGDPGGFGRRANSHRPRDRRRAWRPVESDRPTTTVMIRNIPNKYTRGLMIEFLDKHCQEMNEKEKQELRSCGSNEVKESMFSAYDFFYLPMDFKSGMNKGYAFVNFTNATSVRKFTKACNHQPWDLFISKKRLEVASARIQGKDNLVRHFERMAYPTEEYAAVYFSPARGGSIGDDGASASKTVVVGKCA